VCWPPPPPAVSTGLFRKGPYRLVLIRASTQRVVLRLFDSLRRRQMLCLGSPRKRALRAAAADGPPPKWCSGRGCKTTCLSFAPMPGLG